jgi:hypothetical protein
VAVVVGVLVGMPLRGYLQQRDDVAAADASLRRLERQNDELQRRKDRLEDPSEIQAIARREYGLVDRGQESYTILPPATAGLVLPHAWPFDRIAASVRTASAG